jgi:TolB-like protein/Tfp pilus assembly protein PilF
VTDATEGESTWARLTRRKVVQWGIAYAAGAWGLLQGLAYVSGLLHWPEQLQRLTGLALLIGLPVVLVLAWYHGDRGQQRVTRIELAILTLLFLLGGGLFWRYQHTTESSSTAAVTASTATTATTTRLAADSRPSIAVLPFENRSDEHKDAFFVDGIHDDILTQLSKVSALKVISRTSVEQFRDTKLPTKTIAEQLGVKSILEGGVQRAGKNVRVTVQLIDATTDTHLWAESYDRELTGANIFAIQSEVAAAIAGALKTTLTPAERQSVNAVHTQSFDAWEAYQLGKQRMARRTSVGLAEAENFFRRAIELDPKFPLAYVGLADTLALQIEYSGAPRIAALARAEQAVVKALELDPSLGEAWVSSAGIADARGQFDRAETMYRRAIALNPNYATAFHWFSSMLAALGRTDEALAYAERAAELDPLSAIINVRLGNRLESVGRFDDAEARYRKVIEIDPSMPASYWQIGSILAYAFNRYADAVPLEEKAVELDPGSPSAPSRLAGLYLDLGDEVQATRIVQVARERWPGNGAVLTQSAFAHLYRGEPEAALKDAHRILALEPRDADALGLLRDADVKNGDYAVARARYARAYPELFTTAPPKIHGLNYFIAIDLVLALQKTGASARASLLLDGAEEFIRTISRLGIEGYGISDVQIYALRGQKAKALAALRAAEKSGWRQNWRYYRDFDPNLASIRNDPEFRAVFADIERDMARQRAELAARPKDAPLDLGASPK